MGLNKMAKQYLTAVFEYDDDAEYPSKLTQAFADGGQFEDVTITATSHEDEINRFNQLRLKIAIIIALMFITLILGLIITPENKVETLNNSQNLKDDLNLSEGIIHFPYPVSNFRHINDTIPLKEHCDNESDKGNIVFNNEGRPFYCLYINGKPEWHTPSLMKANGIKSTNIKDSSRNEES
jgi:hypothetical protein